jgi:hypothetical protein
LSAPIKSLRARCLSKSRTLKNGLCSVSRAGGADPALVAVMKKVETQVDRGQKVRLLLDKEDLAKLERAANALVQPRMRDPLSSCYPTIQPYKISRTINGILPLSTSP